MNRISNERLQALQHRVRSTAAKDETSAYGRISDSDIGKGDLFNWANMPVREEGAVIYYEREDDSEEIVGVVWTVENARGESGWQCQPVEGRKHRPGFAPRMPQIFRSKRKAIDYLIERWTAMYES